MAGCWDGGGYVGRRDVLFVERGSKRARNSEVVVVRDAFVTGESTEGWMGGGVGGSSRNC